MTNKKAFTLLEVILGIILFAIVSIAVANLFFLYQKIIKKPFAQLNSLPTYQFSIAHLTENINNSAWIALLDSNNIELHSHSNPNIRKYKFENNKLKFKKGSGDYVTLAENIDTEQFFKAVGDVKRGNQYRKVNVEFWEKSDGNYKDTDVFYINVELFSKESWDNLFVDPLNIKSYVDGTMSYPFGTLEEALSTVLEEEIINVLSGDYEIYDETMFNCKALWFAPDAALTVMPGTMITMGFNTVVLTEGDFYGSGESNSKITVRPLSEEGITMSSYGYGAGKIVIHNTQDALNFNYWDMEFSEVFISPPEEETSVNLNFSNNRVYLSNLRVYSRGGNFNIFNNRLYGCYNPMLIQTEQEAPHATNLRIYSNTIDGMGESYYSYGMRLHNSGSGEHNYDVHDNYIFNTRACAIFIGYGGGTKSSTIEIYKNTLDVMNGHGGVEVANTSRDPMKASFTIRNNIIKNATSKYFQSFYYDGGIRFANYYSVPTLTIKNNIISGCRKGINLAYKCEATIENNILYENTYGITKPPSREKTTVHMENNVLHGDSVQADKGKIENSIIWGPGAQVSGGITNHVTYSDVPDIKGKGNINEDPLFQSPTSDFHLKPGSPCIDTGDPQKKYNDPDGSRNDMGAYGGPGAIGWDEGVGGAGAL